MSASGEENGLRSAEFRVYLNRVRAVTSSRNSLGSVIFRCRIACSNSATKAAPSSPRGVPIPKSRTYLVSQVAGCGSERITLADLVYRLKPSPSRAVRLTNIGDSALKLFTPLALPALQKVQRLRKLDMFNGIKKTVNSVGHSPIASHDGFVEPDTEFSTITLTVAGYKSRDEEFVVKSTATLRFTELRPLLWQSCTGWVNLTKRSDLRLFGNTSALGRSAH